MRISVVDVGSNTVRLVVADAEGGVPLPVHTAKWRLRLSDHVRAGGPVPEGGVEGRGGGGGGGGRGGAGPPPSGVRPVRWPSRPPSCGPRRTVRRCCAPSVPG